MTKLEPVAALVISRPVDQPDKSRVNAVGITPSELRGLAADERNESAPIVSFRSFCPDLTRPMRGLTSAAATLLPTC